MNDVMNEPKNKTDEFLYSIWNFLRPACQKRHEKIIIML